MGGPTTELSSNGERRTKAHFNILLPVAETQGSTKNDTDLGYLFIQSQEEQCMFYSTTDVSISERYAKC